MYCRNCGNEMDNQAAVCVKCGVAKGSGGNFCPHCGVQTNPAASVCVNCGISFVGPIVGEQKSKLVAGLLGIFLGSLGIHNFYLGYTSKAIIQILVSVIGGVITCGVASFAVYVWGLVEGIMILAGKIVYDGKGVPLKE